MWLMIIRGVIAGAVIVAVTEIGRKYPRAGALLLTLPLVSIVAFVTFWTAHHDLRAVSRMARETLVLVPLGLPFFLPLACAQRLGLGFWSANAAGLALAAATIGLWFRFGPSPD